VTAPPIDFGQLDGHERAALMFSGGKDSLALGHLFKPYWQRLTVVHLDAGDLLPEMRELVAGVEAMVPTFARITTNTSAWIEASRLLPSGLVPTKRHPGLRREGDEGPFIILAFDCCMQNRWKPWRDYLAANGFGGALSRHGLTPTCSPICRKLVRRYCPFMAIDRTPPNAPPVRLAGVRGAQRI
jgi:3'-phosphoadenosine 5'-phosphosulfate sulfotransferase (PAPS reductase)/FAD synthetase